MNDFLVELARGGGPIPGAIATVAGGILGGVGFLSGSGILLGAIAGLGLFGALSPVAAFIARMTGQSLGMPGMPAMATAATAAAAQVAPSGIAQAAASTVMAMATPPSQGGAATPASGEAPTETEAQLLSAGRFDEYHLAKAKRLFAAKEYKEAAYQAGASLAHGDLAEAVAIRKASLAALK